VIRPTLAVLVAVLAGGCAGAPREEPARPRRPGIDVPGLFLAEDAPARLVCGHRGDFYGSLLGPGLNTLGSFDQALDAGVDLVEVDVRVTADRVPVIAHDGGPEERSLAAWLARGKRWLTLEEVLRWARDRTVVLLDLKTRDVAAIAKTLRSAGAVDRALLLAGGRGEHDRIRAAGGDLWVVARARRRHDVGRWLNPPDARILAIHVNPDFLTDGVVKRIHAHGKKVWVNAWDATWHQEFFGGTGVIDDLFERGADIVHTNVPSDAAGAREKR